MLFSVKIRLLSFIILFNLLQGGIEMNRIKSLYFLLCILTVLTTTESLAEEKTNVQVFRCEVYCSQTKLRTVNAKLIWIGPGMPSGPAEFSGREVRTEQIETTVFKNGFKKNLYAGFPTLEPTIDTSPEVARDVPAKLPAYNLKLIGAHKPKISGVPAMELLREKPEKQETTVIIEGLEPGLRYHWRLRFKTASGWTESQTITCEAPVCPADLQEE
jgi:hypothetical protein